MGLVMSYMDKGMPTMAMMNWLTDTLYKQFIEKDISNFEEFHIAILDIFITFNAALPGRHYDAPDRDDVKDYFERWQQSPAEHKKKVFEEFMLKYVNLSKLDDYTVITGMATPPAAMALKRAGEKVPQINMIKHIPDVVFVPSITLLALITAKLSRRISLRKHHDV